MNTRRGQYRNPFSFRSLVVILLGAMLGTVWMVSRVASRNRLHQMTQEQRKLESAIGLLETEIRLMENKVKSLLTHDDALASLEQSGLDLEKDFPRVIPSRLFLLHDEAPASEPKPASDATPTADVAQAIPLEIP